MERADPATLPPAGVNSKEYHQYVKRETYDP